MRTLRLPGVLVVLGFLGLVVRELAWVEAYDQPTEYVVSQIATAFGYGLAGFACWRWIVRCRTSNADPGLQRVPSRWMATASVVTAAGYAAITYYYYQTIQNLRQNYRAYHGVLPDIDPHYRLRMAGGASIVVGLLLAGIGFWIASTAARSVVAEPVESAVPAL